MDAVAEPGQAHEPDAGIVDARIRAAGGVVGRVTPDGPEVVLVHRPRFDDWTLPKGKLKRGEHPAVGAAREVREETGIHGVLGARLPTVQYDVWSDEGLVEKYVDYWSMTVAETDNGQGFTAIHEVDDIVWLPVARALRRLSYPHDRRVLRAFAELPPLRRPVLVVRHASAGEREHWSGPDADRPLDELGRVQAKALATVLPHFGPVRLISAEPLRCTATLAGLADRLGLPVEVDARFDEAASAPAAAEALRELANQDGPVVVCSQGQLIPPLLAELTGGSPARYRTTKGDGWVLSFAGAGSAHPAVAALDAFTLSPA